MVIFVKESTKDWMLESVVYSSIDDDYIILVAVDSTGIKVTNRGVFSGCLWQMGFQERKDIKLHM